MNECVSVTCKFNNSGCCKHENPLIIRKNLFNEYRQQTGKKFITMMEGARLINRPVCYSKEVVEP